MKNRIDSASSAKLPRLVLPRSFIASCAAALVAVTGGLSVAFAQQTDADTTSPAPEDENDLVVLSVFEVDASEDTGYQAQNTLAGTRFNTPVTDVGVTMSIFTEQFLDDLALTSTNDIMLYTPGSAKDETKSGAGAVASLYWADQTVFRGIRTENIYRNQFPSWIPSDSYNAGRFEVSRGSNAILFGIGNPAGLVNRYTNDATFRNSGQYRLTLDNNGSVRHEIDGNVELIDNKLAIYVAGLVDNYEPWIQPAYQDQKRLYGSIVYKPVENLTIKLRGEWMDWHRASLDYGIPQDGVTPYLEAAAAAGHTPAEHAIPHDIWKWNAPGTYPPEFREWNFAGGFTTSIVPDANGNLTLQNWQNKPVGANKQVVGSNSVSLPVGFLDRDFNIYGGAQGQKFNGDNIQAVVQYKVNDKLDLEYAYNREHMLYDFIINWNANRLLIDGASTLEDGVTPNPHAGEFFIDNGVNWRFYQNRYRTHHRVTGSYQLDFTNQKGWLKWLGSHNIAAMYENVEEEQLWDNMHLINTTPVTGKWGTKQVLWTGGWDWTNGVRLVNYIDPATKTIYGETDAWKFAELASTVPGVKAEWLPVIGPVQNTKATTEKLGTTLLVVQSHFWDNRIVTTLGWRRDELDVFDAGGGQYDPSRPLVDDGNGNMVPDGVALWARELEQKKVEEQSALAPSTLSRGIVFHAYRNPDGFLNSLSAYYNFSTSFGSASFNNSPRNTPLPSRTGETTDYGLKFGLMQNRIQGVFTLFEANVLNEAVVNMNWGNLASLSQLIGVEELSNLSPSTTRDTRDTVSKGWELQATANITPSWRVMVAYDQYKTELSNIAPYTGAIIEQYRDQWLADPDAPIGDGNQIRTAQEVYDDFYFDYLEQKAQEGGRTIEEREQKLSIVTSYDFREGILKGWGIGADVVWQSAPIVGYALTQLENGSWVPDSNNPFKGDSLTRFGAHIRYNTRLWNDRINWRIQLNVRDIGGTDPFVVRAGATSDAPTTAVPTYVHRGYETTYVLSNTFTF